MLEIVPQAEADLFFRVVERLVLAALAVVVVQAEPQDLGRLAAPHPAGLGGEVATVVVLLAQMGVESQEGRAMDPRRPGAGNLSAELKLPRLRAPVDAFFEKVLVMDKDERVKQNRIGFLGRLHATMNRIADLSKLAA